MKPKNVLLLVIVSLSVSLLGMIYTGYLIISAKPGGFFGAFFPFLSFAYLGFSPLVWVIEQIKNNRKK